MEKFVCLRIIQMNGVDLQQFQFDYDMSFGIVFMNADGTVYGRYGTRNQRPDNADSNISLNGLRESMGAVLALHKNYPENKSSLAGKTGPKPAYPTAEKFPPLKKYTPKINYESDVAKSCIHCHQIHNAERQMLRDAGKPIPDDILYLYPMPDVAGMEMDPEQRAKILRITKESTAEKAGLKPGDEILFADSQPLISMADFQWVLRNTSGEGGSIPLKILRAGKTGSIDLTLDKGWKRNTDFTWRVSTWDLRRMALGGMNLQVASNGNLEVKGAGKYGGHAVARKAGVRPGDEIKEIAGMPGSNSEGEVIAHILRTTKPGDKIDLVLKRAGKELPITYSAQ